MSNQTPKKITSGRVKLLNAKGEEVDLGLADIRTKKENLNKNFFMLFQNFVLLKTGNVFFDFLCYLLKKLSNKNTVVGIKDENIAKELGVCRQTIESTKKKMHEAGILKYTAGVIFLNPNLIFKGNAYKKSDCENEYKHFIGIGDKREGENNVE